MREKNTNKSIQYMTRIAVLVAVMLFLEMTGLGMLRFGAIEMTILQIPVIVGAIVLGPTAGGIMGTAFGLISFWECFGKSAFGAALLGINPIFTFIVCVVPRVLMGVLCGWIFRWIYRIGDKIAFFIASLSGALLNTAFFMSFLLLLFGQTDYILSLRSGMNLLAFLVAFVGVNGLVEGIICAIVGTAVSAGLYRAIHRK